MNPRTNWNPTYLSLFLAVVVTACSERPVEEELADQMASTLDGPFRVNIMPFSGLDGTCLEFQGSRVRVDDCGGGSLQGPTDVHPSHTFVLDGPSIKNAYGKCLEGNPSNGIVSVTTCNASSVNQRWNYADAKITSQNQSGGITRCLDIRFGSHAIGAELGLAPCNGTAAQVFWIPSDYYIPRDAGFAPMVFHSALPSNTGSGACQCLDRVNGSTAPGTPFVNFFCNGTDAQYFGRSSGTSTGNWIYTGGGCLGLEFPIHNRVANVIRTECNANDPSQRWYFANLPGRGVSVKNMWHGCLDVLGGSRDPATPVVSVACNGTDAQRWIPSFTQPICVQ